MSNFRSAPGRDVEWLAADRRKGFSNFQFVDEKFQASPVLRRILSLARKLEYQSLVTEVIHEDDCDLLAEENKSLAVRDRGFRGSDVARLLFLKTQKDSEPEPEDILGYAVIKQDQFRGFSADPHIYEAVLQSPRSAAENNFVHCARDYSLVSKIGTFSISGVLYAQQNDRTFVCAHVALRTALSTVLPEADVTYAKINEILGIDHKAEKVGGGKGLSPNQLENVLDHFEIPYSKIAHEPSMESPHSQGGDYHRDLYGIIESGLPALLGFELDNKDRHIIPVIGHTFNEDTWVAEANRSYFGGGLSYFPSENWLSTYLVHDDNFGPYYCLPRHYLKQATVRPTSATEAEEDIRDNFRLLLGLKRHRTVTDSVEAEATGLVFLNAFSEWCRLHPAPNSWFDRFSAFAQSGLLVLRTLLITKTEYLEHLSSAKGWLGDTTDTGTLAKLTSLLPEQFWMVEASAPELFSASRRKFGEVIFDSAIDIKSSFVMARLPGIMLLSEGGTIRPENSGTDGHVELFQFCPNGGLFRLLE